MNLEAPLYALLSPYSRTLPVFCPVHKKRPRIDLFSTGRRETSGLGKIIDIYESTKTTHSITDTCKLARQVSYVIVNENLDNVPIFDNVLLRLSIFLLLFRVGGK